MRSLRPDRSAPPPGRLDGAIVAGLDHPRRPEIQAFIEARYFSELGASLSSHYPIVAAVCGGAGEVLAAAGVRLAEAGPLFLEAYLDHPIEQAAAEMLSRPVSRGQIVELGSLASVCPAAALQLFATLAAVLPPACNGKVAALTLRPSLARTLSRAGFNLARLCDADPGRLGEEAASWGSYYDESPGVHLLEIGASSALQRLRDKLFMASPPLKEVV